MSLSAALFVGFCAVNGIQLLQQVVEIGEPANNRIYTAPSEEAASSRCRRKKRETARYSPFST